MAPQELPKSGSPKNDRQSGNLAPVCGLIAFHPSSQVLAKLTHRWKVKLTEATELSPQLRWMLWHLSARWSAPQRLKADAHLTSLASCGTFDVFEDDADDETLQQLGASVTQAIGHFFDFCSLLMLVVSPVTKIVT